MERLNWVLDPTHSELGFKIKHLMISNVSGVIKDYQIEMQSSGEDLSTAEISVKANLASIDTKNEQRDAHLRNSDFFEVEKYPELSFNSTRVEKAGDDSYTVFGDLTMKGITRPVKLNIEYSGLTKDPWGGERAGFQVEGKIRRSEFGLNFNAVLETGGVALGEEVKILGEIQLVKQVAVAAA